MITIDKIKDSKNVATLELFGLSTDDKPEEYFDGIKIANGSSFYCMDTQDVYLYDEENNVWLIQ